MTLPVKEKERTVLRCGCPVRCALIAAGAIVTALYFITRSNRDVMLAVSDGIVRPYHTLMGRLCSLFPFSVAELIYAAGIIAAVVYTAWCVHSAVHGSPLPAVLRRWMITAAAVFMTFFGGICLLWGVFYYSFDFADLSGLERRDVSVTELEEATRMFANLANEYAPLVERDAALTYTADAGDILGRAPEAFEGAVDVFPFLDGAMLEPKAMLFSEIMSAMNFTGFFFPFTGEANINVNAPDCFIPCTAMHEISHQRGIAPEDEANFIAVLACLESGDAGFIYSGALFAYLHLGNALYKASPEAYHDVAATLCGEARADLDANNSYWASRDTEAAAISESVYTGFLYTQGDERGLQSYGACTDLLVAYYLEEGL